MCLLLACMSTAIVPGASPAEVVFSAGRPRQGTGDGSTFTWLTSSLLLRVRSIQVSTGLVCLSSRTHFFERTGSRKQVGSFSAACFFG